MIISSFLSEEYNYILWWIGVVILVFSIIPYLCTGERPSELFYKLLDFLLEVRLCWNLF